MDIAIGDELASLARSLLLGAGLALLYDALRALRRRHPPLTTLLDALYSLALVLSLLAYALRVGMGELRLYALGAASLGGALTLAVLSPILRPLWDFWADCLLTLARLLRAPFRLVKKYYGKLHKLAKRHFLFLRRTLIIENYRRSARRARRTAERKGGARHGQKADTRSAVRHAGHRQEVGKDAKAAGRPLRAASDLSAAPARRRAPSDAAEEARRGTSGEGNARGAGRGAAAGK